jgi:hypothetical protein
MTPDPIRISVDKDIHHLTSLMHAYHVRRVPIVNGFDTTLGIVTLNDLIAELGDEMSEIGEAIPKSFLRAMLDQGSHAELTPRCREPDMDDNASRSATSAQELSAKIELLRIAAEAVGAATVPTLQRDIAKIDDFLRHEVLPHAFAEEEVLYVTVGKILRTPQTPGHHELRSCRNQQVGSATPATAFRADGQRP